MKKVYFVRHGESESNLNGTFAGQRENSSLTPKGKEQAKLAAQDLINKGIKPEIIYISPMLRTRETAQIIIDHAQLTDIEIIIDERITEYDMGSLTGTPIRKVTSKELTSAKGAENPEIFMQRVHNLLFDLFNTSSNILIVSHAGVGRIIEAKKRGMNPDEFYDLEPFPNAKIVELEIPTP